MRLTIAIPTHNRPDHLGQNVRRWLAQIDSHALKDIEVVVFDNSTNDDTRALIEKHWGSRVRYVRNQANIGYGQNINRCLMEAKGIYVWIVADNDIPVREALPRLLQLIEGHSHVALFALNTSVIEEGTGRLVIAERYSQVERTLEGRAFLAEGPNTLYFFGGVSTAVYKTACAREALVKIGDRTTLHQTALVSGVVCLGQQVHVTKEVFYIDTAYQKHYTQRTKFEVTIQSLIRTMNVIEQIDGHRVFDRSRYFADTKNRLFHFFGFLLAGNDLFKLSVSECWELFRFHAQTGVCFLAYKVAAAIPMRPRCWLARCCAWLLRKDYQGFLKGFQSEESSKHPDATNYYKAGEARKDQFLPLEDHVLAKYGV